MFYVGGSSVLEVDGTLKSDFLGVVFDTYLLGDRSRGRHFNGLRRFWSPFGGPWGDHFGHLRPGFIFAIFVLVHGQKSDPQMGGAGGRGEGHGRLSRFRKGSKTGFSPPCNPLKGVRRIYWAPPSAAGPFLGLRAPRYELLVFCSGVAFQLVTESTKFEANCLQNASMLFQNDPLDLTGVTWGLP